MRTCLVAGCLLLVIAMRCATMGVVLVSLWRDEMIQEYRKDHYLCESMLQNVIAVSLLVLLLVLDRALIAVALAVRSCNDTAGIVALALVCRMG